jgi:hypothetical protein
MSTRLPSLMTVARAQLLLLVRMKYAAAIIGLALAQLFIVHVLIDPVPDGKPVHDEIYYALVGYGAVAAALMWASEPPANRRYHWAMPVTRETHDVLRVIAGAVWLLVAIAAFAVVAWIAEDAAVRDQWLRHAPLYWVGMFLVSLLLYLLCSIAALLVSKPLLWLAIAGMIVLISITNMVATHAPVVGDIASALFSANEPASLGAAITGGRRIAPWIDAAPVEPRAWLIAVGVWYAFALCGIALAVRRRPDS